MEAAKKKMEARVEQLEQKVCGVPASLTVVFDRLSFE